VPICTYCIDWLDEPLMRSGGAFLPSESGGNAGRVLNPSVPLIVKPQNICFHPFARPGTLPLSYKFRPGFQSCRPSRASADRSRRL
jgi:hypothetical protein